MLGIWVRSCARTAPPASLVLGHIGASTTFRVGLGPTTFRSSCISRRSSTNIFLGFRGFARPYSTQNSAKASSPAEDLASKDAKPAEKLSIRARFAQAFSKDDTGSSSFTKIIALAKPERKPLTIAVGLLLVSSAVSMSVPFTIGKLIDFFSSTNPVSATIQNHSTNSHVLCDSKYLSDCLYGRQLLHCSPCSRSVRPPMLVVPCS